MATTGPGSHEKWFIQDLQALRSLEKQQPRWGPYMSGWVNVIT